MSKLVKSVARILTDIGTKKLFLKNEPQIEQKRDRYGNLFWQVYDPTTHQSHSFGSDGDVRIWIEKRYHNL